MFNKIRWDNNDFYYKFDINEPVYSPDYFQFFNGNARETEVQKVKLEGYTIRMISNNELMIKGPFYEGYYVVINNIEYPYYKENEPEVPEPPTEGKPKEPEGIYKILEENGALYFDKLPEDSEETYIIVKVKVDEYTNEVYPDYPFRSKEYSFKLNKFHKTEILKQEKNIIYHLFIETVDNIKYFLEYRSKILVYFSTVEGLKSFIKDLELNIPIKPDLELKKLIQEKSVLLKRRFGLNERYTENPEYFPIFKRVVNLYCIEDLISISFINGNFITTGEKGTSNGMTLSKFKIDGDGGTNGYALSTDLIQNLILEAESDLYKSLYKEPINKKKKGAFKCYQR